MFWQSVGAVAGVPASDKQAQALATSLRPAHVFPIVISRSGSMDVKRMYCVLSQSQWVVIVG